MPYKDLEKRRADNRMRALKWNKENPEKHAAHSLAWKTRNPERVKASAKKRDNKHRLKKQGWTVEQVDEAVQLQAGRCWICQVQLELTGKGANSLCADHNHDTGQRRGLLCRRCNFAEGLIRGIGVAPAEWAQRLVSYFETFD